MKKGKTNFRETVSNGIVLLEATDDRPGRLIRGIGAVADVVNQNRRRYSADVLRDAVRRAEARLNRSLGNGHILGEADHPPYGTRLRETVVKWEAINFNDTTLQVEVEGRLIPTAAGNDAIAMMESGVLPGLSLRGYGESVIDTETNIEDVTLLELTGFDLVFEPAFETAGVTVFESKQYHRQGSEEMDEQEKVDAKLATDLAEQMKLREAAEKQAEADRKALAESETEKARLGEAARELEQMKREAAVAAAIAAGTRDLPYGDALNAQFVEAVKATAPADASAVERIIAAKRREYDAIVEAQTNAAKTESAAAAEKARKDEAKAAMARRGFNVEVLGPVVETETGRPEYLEFSENVREQLHVRGLVERNERRDKSPAGIFTRRQLEAFDKAYRTQLIHEHALHREWQEAMATTDLNLPYSVSRAIVAEAVPELVAANVFDFGLIDTSPTRIWFEAYAGETGSAPTVTAEVVTSDEGAWVDLAHKWVRRGTVTVTNNAANVTYTEWTDYRIDYPGGKLYTIAAPGAIGDAATIKVTYTYDAIATGEGGAIERGKGTLAYQDVSTAALRMAVLVNDEASALGQTQLGWDAQARAINMLIREVREKIDQAVFDLAIIGAVESGNTGGTWASGADAESDLIKKLGVARVAVMNDFYMPTAIVASRTNADRISNWTGLTREGFPDALLGSSGFENMQVKGLPVFSTTAMPDTHILVVNRELVQHRVLASRPMSLFGPFQYRNTDAKLTAQKEWYVEQYSGQWKFINNKGGYVRVS